MLGVARLRASKLLGLVAQLVRALACHARGRGFEPHPSRHFFKIPADLAHLVERHLAKVEVAGSSPVIRSKRKKQTEKVCFFLLEWTGARRGAVVNDSPVDCQSRGRPSA